MGGQELRTCYAEVSESGKVAVTGGDSAHPWQPASSLCKQGVWITCCAGVQGLKVLKTTQSGYEGFLHDQYTVLKDTKERIVATSITSTWRFVHSCCYCCCFWCT